MKIIAIIMMLAALFLLYRIAYPKRQQTKKEGDTPRKKAIDISNVVVKSHFVRPVPAQPQTTHTAPLESDFQTEKPDIFVPGNEKREAVVPPERFDEAFAEEPDPEDLDIEPDENETGVDAEVDYDEEAEELRQILGRNAERADGWSIEEMAEVVEAADNPTDGKAAMLYRAEKTDLFEQIVSGDAEKANRIAAIIERHVRSLYPADTDEENGTNDATDFDISEFLS